MVIADCKALFLSHAIQMRNLAIYHRRESSRNNSRGNSRFWLLSSKASYKEIQAQKMHVRCLLGRVLKTDPVVSVGSQHRNEKEIDVTLI